MIRILLVAALLLPVAGCGPSSEPAPPVQSLDYREEAGGILVSELGKPVLFYQLEPRSLAGEYERSNYIHPLYGLDGEELTEDFPADHPHHRGIFWAWHQVLAGSVRAGDQWLARNFSWRLEDAQVLPGGGGIRVTHRWHSPDFEDGAVPIVEEVANVLVHPTARDSRFIDFDILLSALQDGVRLGGSEDSKGYGGFSIRVRMIEALQITGPEGAVEPSPGQMRLGDWVDFSGEFGSPDWVSGVAVLVHPTSEGYPQDWILRAPGTPSMQNPVWPGAEAIAVPQGEPVRLRYRLVVHRGGAAASDLAALSAAYSALR